jgi:dTDP-4-dehydrorhamnose 3,5-epimerase
LEIPECSHGIGSVILSPESTDLIAGIRLTAFPLGSDDSKVFNEIAKQGEGFTDIFPAATSEVSASYSRPGTIKAFVYHKAQTVYWVPTAGLLQVALVDMRKRSPTFGTKNTLYIGALRQWQVLIPCGVAHAYKVIGREPSTLLCLTNQFYDPSEQDRVRYNDIAINYDWELPALVKRMEPDNAA